MIDIKYKITGDLEQSLEGWTEKIQGAVAMSGVAAMALVIYDEAKLLAPVYQGPPKKGIHPGQLRDAIYRVFDKKDSTETLKTYQISWNKKAAPHGFLVEYGTSRAPANAFLRRAFDQMPLALVAGRAKMAETLAAIGGAA